MEVIKRDNNRFYIGENIENILAEITFLPTGDDKITIEHTYVSESLKGQGIGQLLVKRVAEYAREENIKIIPLCPFAQKVMTKDEEYRDVL
jgi:uncharacterized protein